MNGTDIHKSLRDLRASTEAANIHRPPEVATPKLRAKAIKDPIYFCEHCCASLFRHKMSKTLREFALSILDSVENGRSNLIVIPRGIGKTSILQAMLIYCIATGKCKFPVVIAANQSAAVQILKNIWNTVQINDAMMECFPELSHPVRALKNMTQRCASQHIDGALTNIKLSNSLIKFGDVDGNIGATIVARGCGGSVRGLVDSHGNRPDFVLMDDIQKRKTATSSAQVQKLYEYINADLRGLQGGDNQIAMFCTATPICAGDLVEVLEKDPTYNVIKHKLILHPPKHKDMWDYFCDLYRKDLVNKTNLATDYYKANRIEMDEGAEMIDDLAYAPKHISALARAYILRTEMGENAFDAEYMLSPKKQITEISLDPLFVSKKLSMVPRRIVPQELSAICIGIDVGNATALHITVTAFGKGQKSSVIDAYTYPQKGRLTPKDTPQDQVDKIITAALVKVVDDALKYPWRNELGKRVPIYGIGIDRGWKSSIVDSVANYFRRKNCPVYAVKGFPSSAYYPSKHTLAKADNVDLRETDGQRWLAQNADVFKHLTLEAFLGAPLTTGALSLFGSDGGEVYEIAQQICGEKLVEKYTSAKGFTTYRWALTSTGAQNHYLDSTSMTLALATFLRLREAETIESVVIAQTQTTPQTQSQINQAPTKPPIQPKPKSKHRIRLH